MRRALFLAAIAVFAAACANPHQDRISHVGPDLVGPPGYRGADPQAAQGPTGPAEQPGRAGEIASARLQVWSYAGTTGLIGDGPAGQRGAGTVALWTTWCDFGFDGSEAGLPVSEMEIVSEIAAYLVENPSLEIGIDGSMKGGSSQTARDLSDRRAISIRDALLKAGVPASRIRVGAFSNPDRRQEDAIQLLMKTRT
jgi:outer membrane protein OmpA-like peptidoglycan-associated protein